MSNTKWPDLKRADQYGVFLWWPNEGTEWIHPYDIPIALDHIPSTTVFRKSDFDEEYDQISCGDIKIRVKPALWFPVPFEGFSIGDFVEVKSEFGRNEPFVASICEMQWHVKNQQIEYRLSKAGRRIPKKYLSSNFKHVDRLDRIPVRPSIKIVKVEATNDKKPKTIDAF